MVCRIGISGLLALGLLSGCAAPDPSAMNEGPSGDAMSDDDGMALPPADADPAASNPSDEPVEGTPAPIEMLPPETGEPRARCEAPDGFSGSPTTVLETVQLVNALPQPVTLPCFLETLDRPLRLYATSGVLSAQPAIGRRSPRIFLFLGQMILSIVPEGNGSRLLEFGELESNTRSLKAEIEFPVVGTLSDDEPFSRLMYNETLTSCAFCHGAETQFDGITSTRAFVSTALRPAPSERVPLTQLFAEYTLCDAAVEPDRCAILDAVFEHGDVVDGEFPMEMVTFY